MIRFALIDDEALVADSLATLLDLEDDLCVEGVFYSAEQFSRSGCTADVVVTDLQLGKGTDGIGLAQLIDSPVVLVTSYARPAVLKRALAMGIAGVLPKTASAEDFADAIRAVHHGRRWIDPDLAAVTIGAESSPLTQREEELLILAGQGLSVADIAASARLAPGTARNYLSSAMGKVGAANRYEAFSLAREKGWI